MTEQYKRVTNFIIDCLDKVNKATSFMDDEIMNGFHDGVLVCHMRAHGSDDFGNMHKHCMFEYCKHGWNDMFLCSDRVQDMLKDIHTLHDNVEVATKIIQCKTGFHIEILSTYPTPQHAARIMVALDTIIGRLVKHGL